MVAYDGWFSKWPYIICTAVRDHVASYTKHNGVSWGTVGNASHWAAGKFGDHTSKQETGHAPYITANDSWTGGTYDHREFAFEFLLPRLQAGFYKNQVKFFNCSFKQWSANNGWARQQDTSGDDHLHVSFEGNGEFHWLATDEYFEWKADGKPNAKTWISNGAASEDYEMSGTLLADGSPLFSFVGTDSKMYKSFDPSAPLAQHPYLLVGNNTWLPGVGVATDGSNGVFAVRDEDKTVHLIIVENAKSGAGYKDLGRLGTAANKAASGPGIVRLSQGRYMIMIKGTDRKQTVYIGIYDRSKVGEEFSKWSATKGYAK